MQSKLFYRLFDSIWLYLIPIIPILWGIRLSAIKKLSGDAINSGNTHIFWDYLLLLNYERYISIVINTTVIADAVYFMSSNRKILMLISNKL